MRLRLTCIAIAAVFIMLLTASAAGAHPLWAKPYYFVKRTYLVEKKTVDWQIVEEGGIHRGHEEGNDERNWRFTFKTRAEAENKGREIEAENQRVKNEGKDPLANAFLNGAANFETAYSQAGLKGKPGTFEKLTAELIQSVADFLVKFLGLNTMEELVYNQGAKQAYIYGIFPKDKWAANRTIYVKIYSIAWLMMFLTPIWILMKKALSTVNPGIRSSLMGGLLTYFVSMAMMGAVFPVIHFFFWVNDSMIRAFYDGNMVGFFHDAVPGEGFLGAAIVRMAFLSLTLYYNFTYRVRAFVLSLLMVMAPVFIFFVNFEKTRNVTVTFFKELLFNIFVQTFHAVSLYYFVITLGVSGIWDKIVLLMVFIPLTEILRRMIMGSGTMSGHLAALAGMATLSTAASIIRAGKAGVRKTSAVNSDRGGSDHDDPAPDGPLAGIRRTADMQSAGGWLQRGFKSAATGAGSAAARAAATAAGASFGLPFGPAGMAVGTGAGYLAAQKIEETLQVNTTVSRQRTIRRVVKESLADDAPAVFDMS